MQEIKEITSFLSQLHPENILEISSGSGRFLRFLCENLGSYTLLNATDIDDKILQESQEKNPYKGVRFLPMRAQDIPFPDGSYDMVCISRGLHHLAEIEKAVHEMIRIVKPGGWLIVQEMYSNVHTPAQETQVLLHHLKVEIDQLLGLDHFFTFRKEDIKNLFNFPELKLTKEWDFLPDDMGDFSNRIEEYRHDLRLLKNPSDYQNIQEKINQLEKRIANTGISAPPHLFLVYEKI